jgi:hypothetical protein
MEFGIALATEVDSWRWVKRAEELGFTSAWFYDTRRIWTGYSQEYRCGCPAILFSRCTKIPLPSAILQRFGVSRKSGSIAKRLSRPGLVVKLWL